MTQSNENLLGSYRVLDLTDAQGFFCGKILADMGAEVIKIERPGGDPSRNIGPFYRDIPDPEMSLYWFAYNANKRGITLDIECAEGKEIFKKLVQKADIVVESFAPGTLDKLGIGYEALRAIHPRIIMTSITPFGQRGPYRDFVAGDMTVMAMGGWTYLCGEPGRPPVVTGFPQSYLCAAGDAATGTVIALYSREASGQGQHVDVSAQQSVMMDTREATGFWALNREILQRSSPYRLFVKTGPRQRWLWKCKDGFVSWTLAGGPSNRVLVKWMERDREGTAQDLLGEMDWENWDVAQATEEFVERMEEYVGSLFLRYTKAELFEKAVKEGILLYPASTVKDLMDDVQLKARDFWIEVEHPELGEKIIYPGPFVKFSESPLKGNMPAPRIGEHNAKIYKELLGFSNEHLVRLKQAGVI